MAPPRNQMQERCSQHVKEHSTPCRRVTHSGRKNGALMIDFHRKHDENQHRSTAATAGITWLLFFDNKIINNCYIECYKINRAKRWAVSPDSSPQIYYLSHNSPNFSPKMRKNAVAIIVLYTGGVISWQEPGRGRQLCRRCARYLCSGVWSIDICPAR